MQSTLGFCIQAYAHTHAKPYMHIHTTYTHGKTKEERKVNILTCQLMG